MNDLQNQMKELEKKLEYLEQQGVEQERILRARRKGELQFHCYRSRYFFCFWLLSAYS